ncbi:MAG: hypothetical protein KGY74_07060 [Candidatus Cloacimonetes bacterium]|nr:hypothetical protein [Candidatus Cloacimonadota bacterium]
MKRLIVYFILILISVSSSLIAEKPNRFALKSAHIVYELSGNTEGKKEVWFDNYGTKYYEQKKTTTTIEMFGIKNTQKEHKISITVDGTHYDIDMINKTGYKSQIPEMEAFQQYAENMTEEEQDNFKQEILDSFGGKIVGNEKFMDKECEIMELMGRKSWLYKGVALKGEGNVMGVVSNETAREFKENPVVPASQFDPPAGIAYEEAPKYGYMGDEAEEGEYYEDEYEEGMEVPISLAEFKNGIKDIENLGYKQTGIMDEDRDSYTAMFIKESGNMLIIGASAYEEDEEIEEEYDVETFTHKGKKIKFATITEDEAKINVILVQYPSFNLVISLSSIPKLPKSDLLKISDELKF